MLNAVGIDIFIDGLVLGLAFITGAKAGLLLTVALNLEVLFLGLIVTEALQSTVRFRTKIVAASGAIALILPVGLACYTHRASSSANYRRVSYVRADGAALSGDRKIIG